MRKLLLNSKQTKTDFIELTTSNCKACWKCIESCPEKVIGKVSFLAHKHVILKNPKNCIGCLKCIKVCEYNAYKSITHVI